MKLSPPAKGSKRPDAAVTLNKYRKYGKDNYFNKVRFKGENHANWKGSNVGYGALHRWLERELGKSMVCEFCGLEKLSPSIHWANKSGKYMRELGDWMRLCAKCHWHYDRNKKII
jgi:hypothetical protein